MRRYTNIIKPLIICFLVLLIPFYIVKAEINTLTPTNLKYINDYVGVIDTSTKEYLVSLGKELEDKTTAQAVIVVINSLEGSDIESYANELFRTWGIGQKNKNNGLLILVAINDRSWRVEVGGGLEGAVTDIFSSRVMNEFAAPAFSEDNYSEGLKNVYSVFADNIAKEYNVTLDKNMKISLPNVPTSTSSKENSFIVIIAVAVIVLDLIFNRGRFTRTMMKVLIWSSHGKRGGGRRGGGSSGGGFGGFGGGSSRGGGSSGKW